MEVCVGVGFAVEMGRTTLARVTNSDGEGLAPIREKPARPTAAEKADELLWGEVGRASRIVKLALRLPGEGGLTDEELVGDKGKALGMRFGWAERVLKMARLGERGTAGKSAGTGKQAKARKLTDAEAEPEDDSGVPEDLFDHLR